MGFNFFLRIEDYEPIKFPVKTGREEEALVVKTFKLV